MTREEAVVWLINIMADIGKAEHRNLWHYEQALMEIREMLESQPEWKKGRWEKQRETYCSWSCSVCKEVVVAMPERMGYPLYDYCPVCGSYNGEELPSAQQELEHTMEEFMYGQDLGSPEDGSL